MPQTARTDTGDMLRNIGSAEMQQRGNLNLQALLQFLQSRQLARLQAGQMAGGVGAPQEAGRPGIGQQIGNLVGLYAQQQALKQGRAPVPVAGGGGQPAGRNVATMGTQFSGTLGGTGGGFMGIPLGGPPKPAPMPGSGSNMAGLANAFGGMLNRDTAGGPGSWVPAQTQMGALASAFGGMLSRDTAGGPGPMGAPPPGGPVTLPYPIPEWPMRRL